MESSDRSGRWGGGRRSCTLWTSRTSYLQGTMLMLVVFMTQFHWVASERNEGLMASAGTLAPWNKTLYKNERRCEDFHFQNNTESSYFYFWPEDDPHFDHCCSVYVGTVALNDTPLGKLRADLFTYGVYGPQLSYVLYYDLGTIDWCFPYWKCNRLYQRLYATVNFYVPCERTDLQRLYKFRFWNGCVFKYGLLQSALPFILILEVLVILFALFGLWRQPLVGSKYAFLKQASAAWFAAMHKIIVIVWVHIWLLATIGNGLLEAVGHQDFYQSQSKSFFNYARLYVFLTVLLWLSSFLQQLSYWIAVIEDWEVVGVPIAEQTSGAGAAIFQSPNVLLQSQSLLRYSSVLTDLEEKIGLTSDWKWQPIAAQVGILFCLWGFLTYVDDNNSMAAGVFGIIVQAAAPWSGLYALKIIFNTLPFLARRLYNKLKACGGLPRCQSGRHQRLHADPEAQEVPLAGRHILRSDTP